MPASGAPSGECGGGAVETRMAIRILPPPPAYQAAAMRLGDDWIAGSGLIAKLIPLQTRIYTSAPRRARLFFSDAFTARAAVVSRLRGELRCQRGDVGRRSSCLLDLLAEAAPNFPHELGGRLERPVEGSAKRVLALSIAHLGRSTTSPSPSVAMTRKPPRTISVAPPRAHARFGLSRCPPHRRRGPATR